MSNPYIGWVNIQMVAVRHHLSLLVEETNANERLRNRGVLESAAWHLQRAYRYYLCELGANYQLGSPEGPSNASELGRALEAIGKHPGEAAELENLEKHGWIGELLGSVADLDTPESAALSLQRPTDLQLVDLDKRPALTAEGLSNWLSKFKELTTRHRDVMVEY